LVLRHKNKKAPIFHGPTAVISVVAGLFVPVTTPCLFEPPIYLLDTIQPASFKKSVVLSMAGKITLTYLVIGGALGYGQYVRASNAYLP
jgi:hypothetical protein